MELGFVEFKERVEAGEPALQVAEELLYQLGEGSTRIVYGFSDNPTIVLKIINTTHAIVDMDKGEDKYGFTKKHKVVSNQNEADLQMQQQYQGQVPPEVQQQIQDKMAEEVALDVAEMTELFAQTVEDDMQIDPLVQLRQQELALKEADMERKGQEFQQRLIHDIRSDDNDTAVDQERLRLQEKNIDERTEVAQERIDVQREKNRN